MSSSAAPLIRPARPDDCPAIHAMVHELAEFERLADHHVATVDDLHAGLFGPHPSAAALVAESAHSPVGFALFFPTFSTFVGKPGLWLEDLYVRPAFRGQGLGRRLLREVAATARARGCGRLEWAVLDWNTRAIDLYRSLGAVALNEWTTMRLCGAALTDAGLRPSDDPAPAR